jgi:hypothetical protein
MDCPKFDCKGRSTQQEIAMIAINAKIAIIEGSKTDQSITRSLHWGVPK